MHEIIVQLAVKAAHIPKAATLRKWAKAALENNIDATEVTIRVVDTEEMTQLNSTYRKKNGPTNVLSFPFQISEEVELEIPLLGDIVICAEVVEREALQQNKPIDAHWAHLVVHGIYHLLGHDHEDDTEAEIMEALEIKTMLKLGFSDPYQYGDLLKDHD